jgi:hypothetical protein
MPSSFRSSNTSSDADAAPNPSCPTVESFSLDLQGLEQVLQAKSPTRWLEAQLLARLHRPIRLLRWAIVQADKLDSPGNRKRSQARLTRFRCEGAYLRRPDR